MFCVIYGKVINGERTLRNWRNQASVALAPIILEQSWIDFDHVLAPIILEQSWIDFDQRVPRSVSNARLWTCITILPIWLCIAIFIHFRMCKVQFHFHQGRGHAFQFDF